MVKDPAGWTGLTNDYWTDGGLFSRASLKDALT